MCSQFEILFFLIRSEPDQKAGADISLQSVSWRLDKVVMKTIWNRVQIEEPYQIAGVTSVSRVLVGTCKVAMRTTQNRVQIEVNGVNQACTFVVRLFLLLPYMFGFINVDFSRNRSVRIRSSGLYFIHLC